MKNRIYWIVTLLFPFLLLGLIEGFLILGGYNEDSQRLFVEVPSQPEYLTTNSAFISRYFPAFQPQVGFYPLLKEKRKNTFRVFVLGGSSTQGFPYNFYSSFASKMEEKLLLNTQGLNIEVVNLGMTAVNSFVIWDLSKRLTEYEPDAVIIYAGHNEYYGSFGVGSTQFGFGKQLWLKRLILRLKNWRIYQLIEQVMKPEQNQTEKGRTMMASVVREAGIELGSELYQSGIHQFETNIRDVARLLKSSNIPLYIGTVASNLKDQPPLSDDSEANDIYREGVELYENGDIEAAHSSFDKAKEKDVIRFRAPNEINSIIKKLSESEGVTLVDIENTLKVQSESGIEDESLFIDHLHPNSKAHRIIADLFYDHLSAQEIVGDHVTPNIFDVPDRVSRFEETFASITIARLLVGFPFQKGLTQAEERKQFELVYNNFLNSSYIDSVAAYTKVNLQPVPNALNQVVDQSKKEGDTLTAMSHYYELLNWQLNSDYLIERVIEYGVNNPEVEAYLANIIERVLNRGAYDPRYINVLSNIYMNNQAPGIAKYWLDESLRLGSEDPALYYNLTRYYLFKKDSSKADEYYKKFLQVR